MKSLQSLSYHKFNTTSPGFSSELRDSAFQFWKNQWKIGFTRLGIQFDKINSDNFLNRTAHLLCQDQQPVGLVLSEKMDISKPVFRDTSYFNNYPEVVTDYFNSERFESVTVLTYLTIESEWRHSKTDFPISDLLFSLATLEFINGDTDCLLGYIRMDKDVHNSFYRHGLRKIDSDMAYNVPVDYCYTTKERAHLSSIKEVNSLAILLSNSNYEKERIPA